MAQDLVCVDMFMPKMTHISLESRCVWGPSGLREGENFVSLRPCSQENSSWLNSSLLAGVGRYIASSLLSKSLISRFLTPSTVPPLSDCTPFAKKCLAAQMASAGPLAILLGLQAQMGLRLLLGGTSVCEYLCMARERGKRLWQNHSQSTCWLQLVWK